MKSFTPLEIIKANRKYKESKSLTGFTLIETLVTIIIFSLIIVVVFNIIVFLYQAHGYAWEQSVAIDEARRGIETMVKEIREARPGDDGSYIIEEAEDFQFIFYSDIDQDEKTEKIRYFIEGTDFKKGVIKPTGWPIKYDSEDEKVLILSTYVRNLPPIFRYFDGQGNELPSPARLKDTKLMRFYLTVNVDPNRPPQDFELESEVQIRNLKTNF